MQIRTYIDRPTMSRAAARHAADRLRDAIERQGRVRIIAATGASQFDFLEALTAAPDVDWSRVEMFHLDEYVGLPITHPASFRKYLLERLITKVGMGRYHFLDGELDPQRVAPWTSRSSGLGKTDISPSTIRPRTSRPRNRICW
jgi:glucosamine-6-phosphate deaminase